MEKTVHTISDMEDATAEHVSKLEDKVDSFFFHKNVLLYVSPNTLRVFYKYKCTRKFKENQRKFKAKIIRPSN